MVSARKLEILERDGVHILICGKDMGDREAGATIGDRGVDRGRAKGAIAPKKYLDCEIYKKGVNQVWPIRTTLRSKLENFA